MIKNIKKRWTLTVQLVVFVFAVMMAGLLLAGGLIVVLHWTGVLDPLVGTRPLNIFDSTPFRVVLIMMSFSIIIGTAVAMFFSKRALKPINTLVAATHRVAKGDFSTRIELKGIMEDLSHSFNKMVNELSTIETLRSDFINNFSHEFKTPIVSIRGFAKLLEDGGLSDEEKREYLAIIIAESERLAELSANILNLSKYESLEIITEKMPFRIDEQIRRAVVLTEPKWSAKNIDVNLEIDEIIFDGNENVAQQIWINLLDNAIKFTGQNGKIDIKLKNLDDSLCFSIQDNGIGMDEETRARIFDKFFQGDKSHTGSGNGLGLTLVKRIVELFGGSITVESSPGVGSVFTVCLPK